MNIYLDIDGTLIHEGVERLGEPADGLAEFIQALGLHDPHWLTTHCHNGDPGPVRTILKALLAKELYADINRIKPTHWNLLKTDAIDFSQPFMWIDNTLTEYEEDMLRRHAVEDRQWFVEVDLEQNPNRLYEIVKDYLSA